MASIWDKLNEDKENENDNAQTQEPEKKNEENTQQTDGKQADVEEKPADNEEAGSEKPTITLRERIIERGRSKYPDDYGEGDFDDERYEGMVDRMLDDTDKDNEELGKLRESSKKLFSIFAEHPDTMQVFENLKGGMSLKKALTEVYGREYLDTDPDSEEEKEYLKKKSEEDEKNKAIAENLKASESDRKKFYEESGMSEDEIKAFEDAENEFWDSYGNGKFDSKYYGMIKNHINHDKDMKAAEEQGRVDGRNEKIVEEKFNDKSDGIPTNEGGAGKKKDKKDEGDEFADDGARLFGGIARRGNSIWDKN